MAVREISASIEEGALAFAEARAESLGAADEFVAVSGDEAIRTCRALAAEEGILAGLSGGATLAAAFRIAERVPAGSTLLAMLPDTGERYQSTPLFEDVPVEMTEEELAIAASTPSCRFDAPAGPGDELDLPQADPEAVERIVDAVTDRETPVVLFALTWCEFCWSVRRLFRGAGIEHRSIDLDSPAMQDDGLGSRMRVALRARTGSRTLPQVFVGGELIGGCTETLSAWSSGRLQELLSRAGVDSDREAAVDAERLLPGWVHPRG